MTHARFNFLAKFIVLAVAITGLCFVTACKKADPEKTIKIYLPGAYMDDHFIPDFEKQFDAKVIVENFDSNEMMYAKIQAGDKYDVLIPSDYMIERLMKQKLLQPLDKSAMTNMGELSDAVKKMSFDPDNTYAVPYFWGTVGIVYNKNNVPLSELFGYATAIRSLSRGRATYSMEPAHFEKVPKQVQDKILEKK